jgi:hypothetical protein
MYLIREVRSERRIWRSVIEQIESVLVNITDIRGNAYGCHVAMCKVVGTGVQSDTQTHTHTCGIGCPVLSHDKLELFEVNVCCYLAVQ